MYRTPLVAASELYLSLESSQDEKSQTSVLEEASVSFEASSQQTAYEEFYDGEPFESDFDSDEEFGKRGRKRRAKKVGTETFELKENCFIIILFVLLYGEKFLLLQNFILI